MATTFDPTLADNISKVRIQIGDTGDGAGAFPRGAEVTDETIQYFLSLPLTPTAAAARVAWTLVAKYASMVDITVDHQTTKASQRYTQYLALAKRLDVEATNDPLYPVPAPSSLDGPIVTGVGDHRGPIDFCWPTYGGVSGFPFGYWR